MANVQYLNPETIPPPIGNGYTHVVKIGPWVYIAGQVGGKDGVLDPDASVQADIVYTKLRLAMESVGGRLNDLVATTTYVTDPENGQKVREVRGRYFGDDPPASTFINIQQLARPEILLEIDAVGYLEKNTDKEGGETMADVQRLQPKGMSPTNNRYSHVVKIGPWVYIAGQTAADENGDWHNPVAVKERPRQNGRGIERRGPPVRKYIGDSKLLGCRRLAQVLIPQKALKSPRLRCDEAGGNVVEDVHLLPGKRRERSLRNLREEDDGDPFCRRSQ